MTCFHARFAWLVACLLLAISVASAHEARVPEPSSFLLMGIGCWLGCGQRGSRYLATGCAATVNKFRQRTSFTAAVAGTSSPMRSHLSNKCCACRLSGSGDHLPSRIACPDFLGCC